MPSISLYFKVHQPYRLRPFSFFDIGGGHGYEDEECNPAILSKITDQSYLPANALLLELIKKHEGAFRVAFCLSGIALEQLERYRPDAIKSFQRLAATGCVEFLGETYFHSLCFLFSHREFREQVKLHREKIQSLFGCKPVTFRFTELVYTNHLADLVRGMGYEAILAAGTDKILDGRSPNFVYAPAGDGKIKLLLKNCRLSDDIALRFSDSPWAGCHPARDMFDRSLPGFPDKGEVINLFMDYESLGVGAFLDALAEETIGHKDFLFRTPAEVVRDLDPAARLDIPDPCSREERERALAGWLGNALQQDAMYTLYDLEGPARRRKDPGLIHSSPTLQTADHFSHMDTMRLADGDGHHASPYDVYINYMNVLDDFSRRLEARNGGLQKK